MRNLMSAAAMVLALPALTPAEQLQKINPEGLSTPQTYTHVVKAGKLLASPEYKVEIEAIAVLP